MSTAATAASPYRFQLSDFRFSDEDGDALTELKVRAPTKGTLRLGSTVVTGTTLPTATIVAPGSIPNLSYYPPTGQAQTRNYDTFRFAVDTGHTVTSANTMTIHLFNPTQEAATGAPTVSAAAGATAWNEDVTVTASASGITDPNGINTGSLRWKWQVRGSMGAYTDISGATAATFTPRQADVGTFIRVCASFRDLHATPADETRCSSGFIIANVSDAPMGADSEVDVLDTATSSAPHDFDISDFPFTDEDGDTINGIRLTSLPTRGTLVVVGETLTLTASSPLTLAQLNALAYYPDSGDTPRDEYASFTYRIVDTSTGSANISEDEYTLTINTSTTRQAAATGAPGITPAPGPTHAEDAELTAITTGIVEPNRINQSTLEWRWQSAPAPASGTPADGAYTDISGATAVTFTPLQAHVGMYIRVCASYMDEHATPAEEGPLCSAAAQVHNVDDAPRARNNRVDVLSSADASNPQQISLNDFLFNDEDNDSLVALVFVHPRRGFLIIEHADGQSFQGEVDVAGIDRITYYPDPNQGPTDAYDGIGFRVVTSDGTNRTRSNLATLTIDLVASGPVAATGQPAITGTPTQGQTLTAAIGTVRDANGINQSTIMWQWQQASPATGGAAPEADSTAWSDIAGAAGTTDDAGTYELAQAQVGQYVRVCVTFMDNASTANAEGPFCSAPTAAAIANANDAPTAMDHTHTAQRTDDGVIIIPVSAFQAAYMDVDTDDMLASVTITTTPPAADGTLSFGGSAVSTSGQTLMIENDDFMGGPLSFEAAAGVRSTSLMFTLSDSNNTPSNEATLRISFGSDIAEQAVVQTSAILSATAITNATNAIGGAISSVPTPSAFDLSLDGTSLVGAARTLRQSTTPVDTHRAWYHGTTAEYEYDAAYNASDNSAESLLHRLQSMADGDIAMTYSLTDTSTMRFWARYHSADISGNEDKALAYDGSGTGFYIGADNQITDTVRIGLAIGTDSADMTIDLDNDETNAKDDASRSATTLYPYMQMDLGNNNHLRVIAGIGSGDLDIKSSANNSTASAGLSWNMLAASIRHHRPMKGKLSARFDSSLQLGNSSTDAANFSGGSSVAAADASTNEIAVNAELRYKNNNFTPFASITARKLGGDLSQSLAMDLGLGADLQTNPAIIRLSIYRQLNDTDHKRDSLSLDIATRPNQSGLSASLGSRYDSLSGRPQWQSTVRWQYPKGHKRRAAELSLTASPNSCQLQARLHW